MGLPQLVATQPSFKIYQVLSMVEDVMGVGIRRIYEMKMKIMMNDLSTDHDGGIDNMSGNYDVV